MRKKISLKKKRISKKEIRDYYNITATDNVRSLKHLRKKKPVVNAVVEPVIEINPDPDEVDYKKLLENKIKECQDCKNKDTKNNNDSIKSDNKIMRSSLKTIIPKYSNEEKEKQLNEYSITLKNKFDKEIITDYLNGYNVPDTVYWPSLNNHIYILKADSEDIDEKTEKYIKDIVTNKYFMFYAYIIYIVEDKNKKKTYYHYLNMKFWKQPSLTTNNFKEYELLNIRGKNEINRIITGCKGGCNTYSKMYMFKNYDKYYFNKKIVKKIKELNNYIIEYNSKYNSDILLLNRNNVFIENAEGIEGSDIKTVNDIKLDNFI